jgi:RimJ/RimL family protein N-acetyltransferase
MATLEGRIVRLEPLGPEHEDALWEASRDPRTWTWLSILQPQTREAWRVWMEDAIANEAWATVVRGVPLGSTRYLNVRPHDRSLEIGWTWLSPSAWNTGANAEAKYLQLKHAFEELHCLRVEFKTDARNERARRALEALPAQFEGIHRKHMLVRGGERRDSAWYSVLDDEWLLVKTNLERRLSQHEEL